MFDLKLLEKLCMTNAVSGNEDEIRDIIISEIDGYVDECKVDNLGNIIVFKRGKSRPLTKLMISCHMDEVGFIVTHITSDGLLKFIPVGGINESVVLGKSVTVGDKKVAGVIGAKPIHLLNSKEKDKKISFKDMYIDIGAKSKNNASKHVQIGDFISFNSIFDVTNTMIRSKALDDRVGCLLLIEMIKKELPYDMYFTFVVQEEVGLRGSKTATYSVDPDSAIVVEATTAADLPDVSEDKKVCKLNFGTVVSFMDKSTIYDKEYYKLALNTAKEKNIKVQSKEAVAGGNDSGAIHVSRGGVRTIALSIPCRYLHSPISEITKKDLDSMSKILFELSGKIASLNRSK